MSSTDFYKNLPAFTDFADVLNPHWRRAVPDDWLIVVSDIKGSTAAIADGKYKDVNVVGASAIIAVLNAIDKDLQIPYVFGGDGASFVIPPELAAQVAGALLGTRKMAAESFGLTLRAGIVPVATALAGGAKLNIAKYTLSENVTLAMFEGGALTFAENLIKDPAREAAYDISNFTTTDAVADFGGLECRWNPLKARKGESLTLIVRATGGDTAATYKALLDKISGIYGGRDHYRPAHEKNLSLTAQPKYLRQEHGVQTHGANFTDKLRYAWKLAFEWALAKTLLTFDIHAAGVNGKQYVSDVVTNTDFQKFDDMLRMVIDGEPRQNQVLINYLEDQSASGKLVFGTSIADASLMTCLIFNQRNTHLHFIDGAKGGYALAAKAMKEKQAQKA